MSESTIPRRAVFVVGPQGSGSHTMAGVLERLGVLVPAADGWVDELHAELLDSCGVDAADARPSAWFDTGRVAAFGPLRVRVAAWLEERYAEGAEVAVADPRLMWFAGLWRSAALRCDAGPSYVVMLRAGAEVVARDRSAGEEQPGPLDDGVVRRTSAWINLVLHTERATRGSRRVCVRYDDLLVDWTVPLARVGDELDLSAVREASANVQRAVHAYLDPARRTTRTTWDELDLPPRLREIAETTESLLDRLAAAGGDEPQVHDELDRARAAYAELYTEAEAIADSSVRAARRGRGPGPSGLRRAGEPAHPVTAASDAAGPGRGPDAVGADDATPGARSRSDVVPHGVRALVPPRVRSGLRRTMGRERT